MIFSENRFTLFRIMLEEAHRALAYLIATPALLFHWRLGLSQELNTALAYNAFFLQGLHLPFCERKLQLFVITEMHRRHWPDEDTSRRGGRTIRSTCSYWQSNQGEALPRNGAPFLRYLDAA